MAGLERTLHKLCKQPSFTRSICSSHQVLTNKKKKHVITNVTVVGGGLMGSGIAQVAAQNDFTVVVVDAEDEYLQKCMVTIRKSLGRITKKKFPDEPKAASKFIDYTLSKITTKLDLRTAVANADIVIEAIPENLDLKHKLFRTIDEAAPLSCLFASNTSSLSISEIAKVTNRTDKFGGIHFFNPVPMMKLVEVVKAECTSQETFNTLFEFTKNLGKTPVSTRDTPGFIVNQILVPYMMEAIRLMEVQGITQQDIDTAMKLGAGYPMGPLELVDYVGLDTLKYVVDGWHKNQPDKELYKPSETLNKLVSEGKLGRKSGEGFYKYTK